VTEADPPPAYARSADAPTSSGWAGGRPPQASDGVPPSEAGRHDRPRTREERELEHRLILAELDAIHRILGVPLGPDPVPRPPPSSANRPPAPPPEIDVPTPDSRGAPSPYLDDRLASAREVAAGISEEFEAIHEKTEGLGESVAALREELDRAAEELAFLRARSAGPSEPTSPPPRSPPNAPPSARPVIAAYRPSLRENSSGVSPSYASFSVSRYNETVREVRGRRRRLFWTTLVAAAAISGVLVPVAYWADEAMPAWWLAWLPLVWMIPVPFFLASFVGTHRILASHALDLPEAV
jgi:hypothetical protein